MADTYIGFDAPPSLRNRYRLNDQVPPIKLEGLLLWCLF